MLRDTANAILLRSNSGSLSDCTLQYKMIIESTFDSIITVDDRCHIVEVNAATTRMFGRPAADFTGLDIDDLIVHVNDDTRAGPTMFSERLRDGERWLQKTIKVVARGLNGREFLAELTVIPTRFGNKSHRIVFAREVTEREFARRALYESEQKYRELIEQMLEGVYRSLGDGTVLSANPAMVRLLGYSSEDELCRLTNAHDLHFSPEHYETMMKNLGEKGQARGQIVEILCKDGSRRTVLANMKAIPGQYGGDVVYQGTFSDVGELQRTTYSLRDSEEHFRALSENSPDIITVISKHAEVLYVSPSLRRITAYEPNLRRGRNAFEHIHDDDRAVAERAIGQAFDQLGKSKWFDFRYIHRDGGTLYMESVATAFVNSRGDLRCVINTRDISERHRTNQQLQQAQKMQAVGQLTGGIAHDFNNLLTVIVGNLQLLEESTEDSEAQDLVSTAFRAAMRGADLTHHLLAFAKRQSLEPEIVIVNELLAGMQPLLRRSLGESLRVNFTCDESLWPAKVDPVQLESAILNLSINARDAMGSDGELTITTSNCSRNALDIQADPSLPCGDYVQICVMDNGDGMSELIRKSAVEPFFTTKQETDGSGLGLSMVYGFVQQSGGHMRLESESGHGTRVMLYLPRSTAVADRSSTRTQQTEAPSGRESVLVVDDNDDVRKSVARLVAKLGYEVQEAANGDAALRILESSEVDLVFSDVRMPGMTGFELASRTRKRHPETRVILTSGFSEQPPANEQADNIDILPKPYNKRELATRFRAALEN